MFLFYVLCSFFLVLYLLWDFQFSWKLHMMVTYKTLLSIYWYHLFLSSKSTWFRTFYSVDLLCGSSLYIIQFNIKPQIQVGLGDSKHFYLQFFFTAIMRFFWINQCTLNNMPHHTCCESSNCLQHQRNSWLIFFTKSIRFLIGIISQMTI